MDIIESGELQSARGRYLMFVKWIASVIVAINANNRVGEIAAGVSFALLLALIPSGNLLWIVLFAITFFLKINMAMELLFLALLKLVAPLADGLLHQLGGALLSWPLLQGAFVKLYNLPLLPLTRFNNTVVMGGLAAGLILWLPVFFLFRSLIVLYRRKLRDKIMNSKIMKAFRRIPLVAAIGNMVRKVGGAYLSVR
jgi:uncharacterized protein (TIGR03546 family)